MLSIKQNNTNIQVEFEKKVQEITHSTNFQILWPGCKKRQKTIEHKVEIGDISGNKVLFCQCLLFVDFILSFYC